MTLRLIITKTMSQTKHNTHIKTLHLTNTQYFIILSMAFQIVLNCSIYVEMHENIILFT